MNQIKLENISMSLDEQETVSLNEAKEKSGIKNTSDLIRFLLKAYTSKSFVAPSLRITEKFQTGDIFTTRGGWTAVWCPTSVYHEVDGGVLYSHNDDGTVRSSTVGKDYDLVNRVTK